MCREQLGVRRVEDGQLVWPEAHLAPGQLLVFAGDALGYLTEGRIPPLVHFVVPPDRGARLSMPFFLRPRLDARLEAAGQVVLQRDIDTSEHGRALRSSWPWKRAAYFEGSDGTQAFGGRWKGVRVDVPRLAKAD